MTQLDGLAAAAAHELGTPLATISLVAKEMERELGTDERYGEDVQLLRSQAERCRDILRRLTTLSSEEAEAMKLLPLSSLIEEVTAPHRDFGIRIIVIEKTPREAEPVGARNAGIIYGLGNLVENAVDYARNHVVVTTEARNDKVIVTIEDDGEGYSPDILQRIGEPYVTSRSRETTPVGWASGSSSPRHCWSAPARVSVFGNSSGETGGARVSVEWPRHGWMFLAGNDFTSTADGAYRLDECNPDSKSQEQHGCSSHDR